jgi:DNA-binding transcriptional MerR regulator
MTKDEPVPEMEPNPPGQTALEAQAQYTIDHLSALTHVPSRTIRYYQSKGALPKPQIKGRVAYYTEEHVQRLGLIARLQDQGLKIKAIRDLLAKADKGDLVMGEWLGLKDQLQTPWGEDTPVILTRTELYGLLEDQREGLIGELLRLKAIHMERDSYRVRSPSLLRITMRLERAGFDLETSVHSAQILRKYLARAAGEVSEHFMKHFTRVFDREDNDVDLTTAFQTLRPMGLEAVQLIFAQEMERVLKDLLASGRTASVATRKKGSRKTN